MKLNNRRTVVIGLAFLSIAAFWNLYESVIPLILRDTFSVGDAAAGWVMALDNILALFMLPLFGRFSDRSDTRIGRRMPYILFGTVAAVALMLMLSVLDAPGKFVAFLAVLALLLVAMGTYRSPAVALMPDVTPKPLRSKGNAIINLMGALGGVFTLGMLQILVMKRADGSANYFPVFAAVGALMLFCAAFVALRVDEKKLAAEVPDEPEEDISGPRLSGPALKSLLLILFSVFFWYMGYNAVVTAYTKYFTAKWGDLGGASLCLMIATIGAVVSYIPIGMLSQRVGRKAVILSGAGMLTACFCLISQIRAFSLAVYAVFVVIGVSWAAINVNSYPMVVELSKGSNVGRYTGFYYTFSMAAQIVTPILSGWLLEHVGYHTLFPYAGVMVGTSFFTMLAVRHGDSLPDRPATVFEHLAAAD
ncbi:MAG: SLC45 family MFS transporter [Clostridiales bacterium]|mgnify:FL=1|nr:SLC45 family MFS transporter [Clostridiales bacterium]